MFWTILSFLGCFFSPVTVRKRVQLKCAEFFFLFVLFQQQAQEQEVVYLYIPNHAVGALIGKKGQYIRQIAQYAEATIKVGSSLSTQSWLQLAERKMWSNCVSSLCRLHKHFSERRWSSLQSVLAESAALHGPQLRVLVTHGQKQTTKRAMTRRRRISESPSSPICRDETAGR